MRGFIHRQLNSAVLGLGDVPWVGGVLWWLFGQWQRVM